MFLVSSFVYIEKRYSSLCELCYSPHRCDKSDRYWGRMGSLYCLTSGDGQVAWARLVDVQALFGVSKWNSLSISNGPIFETCYISPFIPSRTFPEDIQLNLLGFFFSFISLADCRPKPTQVYTVTCASMAIYSR